MQVNWTRDIFSVHLADQRVFSAYFCSLDAGADRSVCQKAIHFAVEKRHEASGLERLSCQLLIKALSYGFGFKEAQEFLSRLEIRADLYKAFSSPERAACYDCYDDPELQENIALLKKALFETHFFSAGASSAGARLRQ